MKKLLITLLLLFYSSVGWGGVDFNGDADYIDLGSPDPDFTFNANPFAIQAWVKTSATNPDWCRIISHYNMSGATGQIYCYCTLTTDGANHAKASIRDTTKTAGTVTGSVNIEDGNWHHILMERGSDGYLRLYVDGTEDGTAADVSALGNIIGDPYYWTFAASKKGDGTFETDFFDGIINEVAFWNNIDLSTTEITLLASSKIKRMPLQIQSSALKGYYPLNDLSEGSGINGATFIDRSGNAHNGTGVDADGDSSAKAEEILSYP